ncbi:microprocessor complex subunit DGCR8-like [Vanessa cardui]|uniref:microprocessor complex subunit DGCR8-like n=1 Tax=Vanessa cardui TaxID=171605 RepID=UPI001F14708C|nr:microprocessor complex subunit DGCR8-like [Vanessa cardui]
MSEGQEIGSPPENKLKTENSNDDNGENNNAIENLPTSQEQMDIDDKIENMALPLELDKEDGLKTQKENSKEKSKKSGQTSSGQSADEKNTKRDFLPSDWKVIWHDSGVPIYMHKPTRVCTLSKPYVPEANKGIPMSSIPYVSQRRALEYEEEKISSDRLAQEQKQNIKSTETQKNLNLGSDENKMDVSNLLASSSAAVEKEPSNEDKAMDIVDEDEEGKQDVAACIGYSDSKGFRTCSPSSSGSSHVPLSQDSSAPASQQSESPNTNSEFQYHVRAEINEACMNNIKLEPFNHGRTNHVGRASRPTKPTFHSRRDSNFASTSTSYRPRPRHHGSRAMPSIQPEVTSNEARYLSMFHEYVCSTLQKQPTFVYKQSAKSSMIKATVLIGNDQYGVGYGYSKREAKFNAVRSSMQRLIPEVHRFLLQPVSQRPTSPNIYVGFDYLGITDPMVLDCDEATHETAPHDVLLASMSKMGNKESHVQIQTRRLKYNCIELTMQVNQHSATVLDNNRRSAKQRAAQVILQALHPTVLSYGSLLRLYGIKFVTRSNMTRRQRRRRIRGRSHSESHRYILSRLRDEMIIVRERDEIYARAAAGNWFFQSSPECETD